MFKYFACASSSSLKLSVEPILIPNSFLQQIVWTPVFKRREPYQTVSDNLAVWLYYFSKIIHRIFLKFY